MPSKVEKGKVYKFPCKITGDFVRIVSGDKELTFSDVAVYGNGKTGKSVPVSITSVKATLKNAKQSSEDPKYPVNVAANAIDGKKTVGSFWDKSNC